MPLFYPFLGIATPFFVLKLDQFGDIKILVRLKNCLYSTVCLRITYIQVMSMNGLR